MKKSRILALLLCLCMLVGVLAACSKTDTTTPDASGETAQSGDSAKSGDVVTIRMWGGVPAESGPQAACDAFNEAYKDKGIQVEYEPTAPEEANNNKMGNTILFTAIDRGEPVTFIKPVSEELQTKILGEGGKPVDCRIEDSKRTGEEFKAAKEALGDLARSEEDVMSYICYPDQAMKFFEARKAKEENICKYSIVEA